MTSLTSFLSSHSTMNEFNSHVSMVTPKGKYIFDREDLEKMWNMYCNDVYNNKYTYGIAEKPENYLPVLVDVDIKIDAEYETKAEHIYNEKHIKSVVTTYQNILKNILKNCTSKQLTCILLEKPIYKTEKGGTLYLKNGFHLHFPFIAMLREHIEEYVITQAIETLTTQNIFTDLGFSKADEVIDKSCCKVPWLLYGSVKQHSMEPYKVTRIFDSNYNEISLEEAMNEYKLIDNDDNEIDISSNIEFYLPRILSIRNVNCSYICEVKKDIELAKYRKAKKNSREKEYKYQDQSVMENIELARDLLPLLSKFRADDRNEWISIGWVLYNISDGSESGLELWCEFSSRSEQYDEAICISEWNKMTKREYSIGTLKHYANLDNPAGYLKLKEKKMATHFKETIESKSNNTDIAHLLKIIYGDLFVCSSIKEKSWYVFKNNIWFETEAGTELRQKISDNSKDSIMNKFIEIIKKEYDKYGGVENKDQKTFRARIDRIQKTIDNLKTTTFINNVMTECCHMFYDREFSHKLDTNPFLIAFKNGVYDFKLNIFRPGRPEDYLSKHLPIDYKIYDNSCDEIKEINNFFNKIFPDDTLRTYFLDVVCDIFIGGNRQKKVFFWLGEGDNGKSVTQKIFQDMLGPFAIKFSTTVITGKKTNNGAANADLARSGGGVRWGVFEEPDPTEKINPGTFKLMSGNDSYFARDLHERGKQTKEITPLYKLSFICNKLPEFVNADTATFNRVRVIQFESTFTEKAPENEEDQIKQKRFPVDRDFDKKIQYLIQPLAWFLIERRKQLFTIVEPEKVKIATEKYRKQSDLFQQFIDDMIIPCKDGRIDITNLYGNFKEWFKLFNPGAAVMTKNTVQEEFERRWGLRNSKGLWKGFVIKGLAETSTITDNLDDNEETKSNTTEETKSN